MTVIYQPNKSLLARVNRRLMPLRHKKNLSFKLDKPIVSFTFDDCPKSVIQNALPSIEHRGWRASLYMSMGLCDTTNHLGLHMSEDDVLAAYKSGHEIADHTFNHVDATTITPQALEKEINENQNRLNALGLVPSKTFAYPYGQLNVSAKKLIEKRFIGARGITGRIHTHSVDLNQINSNRLYADDSYTELLSDISSLKTTPGWLTIYTHDVRETPSAFGCTPAQMENVLEAVKNCGANVMTVADTIEFLESKNDK